MVQFSLSFDAPSNSATDVALSIQMLDSDSVPQLG